MRRRDKDDRILGIDPGFGRVGWGVIEKRRGEWEHVAHGCIETPAERPFAKRLISIQTDLHTIIYRFRPSRAAVEDLFFYKNVKTAIKVGQARGVILLTLAQADVQVEEFTPLQVKQALTGYGRADKAQMQKLLQYQLRLKKRPTPDDAADALAIALTASTGLKMKYSTVDN